MDTRLKFEDLIGKEVRNSHGRVVGRIEDAQIEPRGEEYVITHFMVGPTERLRRLRGFLGELPTFRALGIGSEPDLRPLSWEWFDLSDPEHPVLTAEPGSSA
jgi:sporulation protein YlmC with PRC-barrel domain